MTILDRGLSITWYDLPAEGRDAYLAWLHEVYMPEVLRRPGVLWGGHYAEVEKAVTTASHKPEAVRVDEDIAALVYPDRLLHGR